MEWSARDSRLRHILLSYHPPPEGKPLNNPGAPPLLPLRVQAGVEEPNNVELIYLNFILSFYTSLIASAINPGAPWRSLSH